MRDEENDRPAFGKRDPLEADMFLSSQRRTAESPCEHPDCGRICRKRIAVALRSPMQIQDRDLIEFDGSDYRVRLYPSARNRIQVEVDLIEGGCTIGIFSRAYADNDEESIEEAVIDCVSEISEIVGRQYT